MRKLIVLLIFFLIASLCVHSQSITQIIKGRVYDSESHTGLPGATVIVVDSEPLRGTTTDVDGYFIIEEVCLGRTCLRISYVGYEDYIVPGFLLSSSEIAVKDIPLREHVTGLNEVEITSDFSKDRSLNNMTTVSARSISLEEAQRFAGGMEDFSRLVAAFAGVSPSSIDNNEIIIRGNPAKGILWRLQGVEIPVPNHLAYAFNGGGVVSMFSPFMISNSDFLTGAFPAEYGNVLSGVFDINFRNGDPDRRRYAFQLGTYGADISAEGPFRKGKQATYLANFRYSTFSILKQIMPIETGLPDFTDLLFNLNFPTKRSGVFSLWSMNGLGKIAFTPTKDPHEWENSFDNLKYRLGYGLTATGLNHNIILNKKSYLSSSLSFSGTESANQSYQLDTLLIETDVSDINERNYSLRLKSELNYKIGKRHTNRTGISVSYLGYNYNDLANTDPARQDTLDFVLREKGSTSLLQVFSQSKFQLGPRIVLNAGLHFIYFGMNGSYSTEPRLGISWQMKPRHSFSLAYGKHSRIEPLRIYLVSEEEPGGPSVSNNDLALTKAHHFVAAYDWSINENLHFRLEPYVQIMYDVPVSPDSSFSMINYQNDMFFNHILDNSGTGMNYGVDLTFERYMNQGYYYMLTASVYGSKYKGGNGIEHNTRLNQNYVFNLLGGKEWQVRENNFLSVNGKFTMIGGTRYTAVDQEQSVLYESVIYDYTNPYQEQWSPNYYVDLSLNYRVNRSRVAHVIILQAKNLTMQKDLIGFAYNYEELAVDPVELAIILPYISYKIEF